MTLLRNSRRELAAEARLALDALRDPMLALLLALLAVLLVLAAQAPLAYRVDVGVEDGPGSDLPLVAGFHPRERDVQGTFRWTKDVSRIRLPGVGVRPLQVRLQFIAVSPEVVERGPRMIEVWANGVLAASLPVRPEGAIYRLMLPAPPTGDYLLELRSATFVPAGDERAIGAGLASFAADTRPGPALPAWRSTLIWLACVVPAWLALRRIGFVSRSAWWMLVPLCLLAGLAALLDPPRFAFGAEPSLVALVLAWMVGVAVGRSFPSLAALAQRLGVPLPAAHWRWLALIALVVLATRYGGKIYPDSMPGDIGFHANRLADVARGTVLLVSRNRGVDFPYPPALYLLLMPFLLAGASARVALQLGGALMDAVSVVLVYGLAAAVVGRRGEEEKRRGGEQPLLFSVPLLAAALYSFSAAGYMVTWWNFSTHIFAQFAHLLLVTALVVVWPMVKDREPRTENREPRTENREPRTENREPRTANQAVDVRGDSPPAPCLFGALRLLDEYVAARRLCVGGASWRSMAWARCMGRAAHSADCVRSGAGIGGAAVLFRVRRAAMEPGAGHRGGRPHGPGRARAGGARCAVDDPMGLWVANALWFRVAAAGDMRRVVAGTSRNISRPACGAGVDARHAADRAVLCRAAVRERLDAFEPLADVFGLGSGVWGRRRRRVVVAARHSRSPADDCRGQLRFLDHCCDVADGDDLANSAARAVLIASAEDLG
jgi:hypothetical protein